MVGRKYLPTLAELIDRLSIVQLKEVKILEHKEEYAEEIQTILYDIDLILETTNDSIDANMIRDIIILAQFNNHIWVNESMVRNGVGDGNLKLTHGLNGVRNTAKNRIQTLLGGRKDYKIDCIAADFKQWIPSEYGEE